MNNNISENILGSESLIKLFLKYSIPSILAMIITGSQTIIDGIFVGNFIGPEALASVNIVQPFMQIILGFTFVVSIGVLSILGRKLGAGKENEAQDAFRTATIILGIISILATIIGVVFNKQIAGMLGASSLLIENVSIYLKHLSMFFILVSMNILFGFACRIVGQPEKYLAGSIVSLFVNIILDYVLIKVLGLGMMGAAIATGLAYSSSFFIVIIPMLNKNNSVNLLKGRFELKYVWQMLYNGGSEGIISISAAVTTYLFNVTLMGLAGEAGVIAYTTINYLYQFGIMIIFGISDGIGSIISYNYGKESYDRVNETLRLSLVIQLVIGVVLFLVMLLGGKSMMMLFSKLDERVLSIAVTGSKLFSFTFLIAGFNIISSGFFTAIGNAKASIIISSARGLGFIAIGITLLPMVLGINGIWVTIPIAEVLTALICGYYLREYRRAHVVDGGYGGVLAKV